MPARSSCKRSINPTHSGWWKAHEDAGCFTTHKISPRTACKILMALTREPFNRIQRNCILIIDDNRWGRFTACIDTKEIQRKHVCTQTKSHHWNQSNDITTYYDGVRPFSNLVMSSHASSAQCLLNGCMHIYLYCTHLYATGRRNSPKSVGPTALSSYSSRRERLLSTFCACWHMHQCTSSMAVLRRVHHRWKASATKSHLGTAWLQPPAIF